MLYVFELFYSLCISVSTRCVYTSLYVSLHNVHIIIMSIIENQFIIYNIDVIRTDKMILLYHGQVKLVYKICIVV